MEWAKATFLFNIMKNKILKKWAKITFLISTKIPLNNPLMG